MEQTQEQHSLIPLSHTRTRAVLGREMKKQEALLQTSPIQGLSLVFGRQSHETVNREPQKILSADSGTVQQRNFQFVEKK
jgi:hypothetical protein